MERSMCCGCGACINVCPRDALEYGRDEFGFIVPEFRKDKCVDCGLCAKVCPALVERKNPVPEAYAAMNRDTAVRMGSSSGGIFGALAGKVLAEGGIVYGCTMDELFRVFHTSVEKAEALPKVMRSKYVQSDMGFIFRDVRDQLKAGRKVLFSGTPCQVSALNNFLAGMNAENLETVDIVCHGVPSQAIFDDYLAVLGRKHGVIREYWFHAKKSVKNGMNSYFAFRGDRMRKPLIMNWTEDSYNFYYMKSCTYREICYQCRYADKRRVSDITLCDYWHWNEHHSEFDPEDTVSGVIVSTEKGRRMLEAVSGNLTLFPTALDDIAKHNGCLIQPSARPARREKILEIWKTRGYAAVDGDFVRRHRKEILKGKIRRVIPKTLYRKMAQALKRK